MPVILSVIYNALPFLGLPVQIREFEDVIPLAGLDVEGRRVNLVSWWVCAIGELVVARLGVRHRLFFRPSGVTIRVNKVIRSFRLR